MNKLSIIGAGYIGGQPIRGTEKTPLMFKKMLTRDFIDIGNVISNEEDNNHENIKHSEHVGSMNERIYRQIKSTEYDKLLTVGGDHSIAIGTIMAVTEYRKPLVVWVDAHADINTNRTTNSGNIHGMPLSFLLGLNDQIIPGFEWTSKRLEPEDIIYIGLRDVEDGEKEIIERYKIKNYTMDTIRERGIKDIIDEIIEYSVNYETIHLSFDIDSIDPEIIKSTGTRVNSGLDIDDVFLLCNSLRKTNKLDTMDLVELNPLIGNVEEISFSFLIGSMIVDICF